jgi:hypothetical protein
MTDSRPAASTHGSPNTGGSGVFADDPTVFELDDPVTVGGVFLRVCNLDDGRAAFVQLLEELHDLFALRGVKIARRLIGEDELWILNDGARHPHELLLATGKLVGEKVLFPHDIEPVERVAHQAGAFLVRDILVRKRNFQIFEDRQIVDQVVALKDKANVGLVQFVAFLDVQFMDGLLEKVIFAGPSAVQHADDAEQRRFSRAGRTHESDEFTLLNIQRDAAQNEKLASAGFEYFFKISQLNQRFHVCSLSLVHVLPKGVRHHPLGVTQGDHWVDAMMRVTGDANQ